MIGRRPHAAFGNSVGDREMLEYTGAGYGARLMMLLLHDDAAREYAYGPARGLPGSKFGTFTATLDDGAKKNGWTVVSMKNDWKRVLPSNRAHDVACWVVCDVQGLSSSGKGHHSTGAPSGDQPT
jgi:hypothetical protein